MGSGSVTGGTMPSSVGLCCESLSISLTLGLWEKLMSPVSSSVPKGDEAMRDVG